MTVPRNGQTVHLMKFWEIPGVLHDGRRKDGRTACELELYTTDDLRRLYYSTNDDPIRLRDGRVDRVYLVAEIRWRVFWARFGYVVLLFTSLVAAIAAIIAAS